MKKYIVCVNNMCENDMKMIKVEARNEKEAIILAVGDKLDILDFNDMSIEDIIGYYFDGDLLVSEAVEI